MKKHLALVLALVMVLGSFSFVSAAPDFSDVKDTSFEEAVMSLESLNVLKGYPDGTFKPANTISRAEFAAVAVRVSGLEQAAMAAKGLPTGFSDVPAWHWASGYVGTAAKLGIVNGIGNGMFAPEAPVKYEEAITMVVRALGYEPAAQAKGGYPFGYLIVANEIDLLEDALGTQGTFATRGFVAQITFNALETEMMVQSGYGSETKYVVSGTENTKEKYLIDQMGFKSVEGRVDAYDVDDLEISMTVVKENGVELDKDKDKTYDVVEGFDFYRVHGVTVKAWLDGDKVVLTKLVDKVMFDATEFDADDKEVELITADKKYDLDKDVRDFYFNDDAKDFRNDDFDADYAKIVMDGNKIVWADGVDFDKTVVVEEVNKMKLVDFDDDEYDVEDYVIVKDGKTISIDAIEKGDVVFLYNSDYFDYDGLAVVATITKEGVVTKAYTDSFKLDGTTYSIIPLVTQYLDDDDQGTVDADVLSAYEDEAEKITVVFNFANKVVLMDGTRGVAKTSTYGAILTADAVVYLGRGNQKLINWDFINELDEIAKFDEKTTDTINSTKAVKWDVVEYTIEDDGDLDKVTTTFGAIHKDVESTVKVTDRFEAKGSRLDDSAVVFLMDKSTRNDPKQEVDKVFKWKDAKDYFGEMTKYDVYSKDGKVEYLVVFTSDAGGDFKWTAGVVTKSKEYAGSNDVDVTISIDGVKKELKVSNPSAATIAKGAIVEFRANEDMDEAKDLRLAAGTSIKSDSTFSTSNIDLTKNEILIDGSKRKVTNDTVIFNANQEKISLKELKELSSSINIKVYFDGRIKDKVVDGVYSDTFIKYIVTSTKKDGTSSDVKTDGTVTYIDPGFTYVIIDGKEMDIIGSAQEFFTNGAIAIGDKIAFDVTSTNKMFKITAVDGNLALDASKTYSPFADLTVGGNLTIEKVGTITASNVTVKGKLVVGDGTNATVLKATNFDVTGTTEVKAAADATFNSRLRGDVTVTGTATFKNVEMDGDLDVTGTATFQKTVTVKGAITGTVTLDTSADNKADAATVKLVNDAAALEAAQSTVNNVAFTSGAAVGKVRLSNTATTLEYSLNGAAYVDCDATNTDIEANIGDKIVVRVKATPAANKTLTVAASNITPATMSGATFTDGSKDVTGLTSGVVYEVRITVGGTVGDWVTYTAADSKIVLDEVAATANTYEIRVKATAKQPASTVQSETGF